MKLSFQLFLYWHYAKEMERDESYMDNITLATGGSNSGIIPQLKLCTTRTLTVLQ